VEASIRRVLKPARWSTKLLSMESRTDTQAPVVTGAVVRPADSARLALVLDLLLLLPR